MSDHGHHDPGGHELEAVNTKLLFRLLVSLTLLTFLASVAVVQWFKSQRRELEGRYAAEGSFQLKEYRANMATDLEGVERVAQDIAANPDLLAAPPPPSGWIHPDDLVGAGAAAAAEPAGATGHEDEVEPVPVEIPKPDAPEGEDAEDPEGDDAKDPEGDDAKAPEPKPADDEAEEPKPKKPKPADDEAEEPKPKKPKPKPEPAPADGE